MRDLFTRLPGRMLYATITIAVLASCVSFKGIESTTQLRQPADYRMAPTAGSSHGVWPDSGWAEKIGGAPLQALVDEALAANPGMHAAAANIAAARAAVEARGAAAGPTVDATAKSIYQRYSEFGLVPPQLAGRVRTDNQVLLNFLYDFDFWGRHAAELRSALSLEKVAEAEHHASRLILATAVARAWIQLAHQHAQLDLVEQQIKVRSRSDRLTRMRFVSGLDAEMESEQARQQLAMLRAEQAKWQEAVVLTRNQLAALLGQGPDRGVTIARPVLPADTAIALPAELPLGLLGRRPDIVAARWRVEAAQGDIDSAKTEFYPDVNLTAFAGLSSLGLANLVRGGSRTAGVGPALRLPIFESGSLRAQLKGRVAAYDAAVASYNQALTDAMREVADQIQSLRATQVQHEQRRLAAQAAGNSLKLAQRRETVGTTNMLPVLATEMSLLEQRKAELELRARRADLQITLIKALGGGFDAPLPSSDQPEPAASNQPTLAKPAS